MSATSLAKRAAAASTRTGPRVRATDGPPSAQTLSATLARYIPSDVIAFYVPVAAGIATAAWTLDNRRLAAIGVAIIAAVYTWGAATWLARKAADDPDDPNHGKRLSEIAIVALQKGWWYVLAAVIASFAWATAVPDSWLLKDLDKNTWWLSGAIVALASIVLTILGFFLAPVDENS
jgi:hypothetical protein